MLQGLVKFVGKTYRAAFNLHIVASLFQQQFRQLNVVILPYRYDSHRARKIKILNMAAPFISSGLYCVCSKELLFSS